MSEKVNLALIALCEIPLILVGVYFFVKMILTNHPTYIKINWRKYGNIEVAFDHKADE